MIPINNKVQLYFTRILDCLFFENFFIACCALCMVLNTLLINNLPVSLSPYTIFLVFSSFLVYYLHDLSFKLDFSSTKQFFYSVTKLQLKTSLKIILTLSLGFSLIFFFFLSNKIRLLILLLGLISLAYSFPFVKRKNNWLKLREIPILKTPLIALVWSITTSLIPLLEQNIRLSFSFFVLQVLSRSLFIFALCIPFEMRDLDADKKSGVRTLAVIYGIKNTQITGITIVFCEIIIHHLMQLSVPTVLSLDIASLIAMLWIINQKKFDSKYFYKAYVDGTMVFLFLLLLIATDIS